MQIFKTSTPGIFSMALIDGELSSGFTFDSIHLLHQSAWLMYGNAVIAVIDSNSRAGIQEIRNAATAMNVPLSDKYASNPIASSPAKEGNSADEIGEKAA